MEEGDEGYPAEKPGLKRTYPKKRKTSKQADKEAGESMRKEMFGGKKGKC